MTATGVTSSPVDYELSKAETVRRLLNAIESGKSGYGSGDLVDLDAGAIPEGKVTALFSDAELRAALTRRLAELDEERSVLSERLRRTTG